MWTWSETTRTKQVLKKYEWKKELAYLRQLVEHTTTVTMPVKTQLWQATSSEWHRWEGMPLKRLLEIPNRVSSGNWWRNRCWAQVDLGLERSSCTVVTFDKTGAGIKQLWLEVTVDCEARRRWERGRIEQRVPAVSGVVRHIEGDPNEETTIWSRKKQR